jgi:glycosyltransferase involved in cell wall biosynthesis
MLTASFQAALQSFAPPPLQHNPTVSLCTPTFNRRPFFPYLIRCIEQQTYPLEKIEWVIVDDGTDPVGDLVEPVTFVTVKYIRLENKIPLGEKRNLMHTHCTGDILVYMDDDDYYPPDRVSHAVEKLLQNPGTLIAGSSIMHIYFKNLHKMYRFGPYGAYHATAATFAFRKELLQQTGYDSSKCVAEESTFLKGYSIPMIQLDPIKTILVFSHIHNSVDKMDILNQGDLQQNPYIVESELSPKDFIQEELSYAFYVENIDSTLTGYAAGDPSNKPDVLLNLANNKVLMYQKQNHLLLQQLHQAKEETARLREMNRMLTERLRVVIQGNVDKHKCSWKLGGGGN